MCDKGCSNSRICNHSKNFHSAVSNTTRNETLNSMNTEERNELVDMIAQAVIDQIAERERVNRLADLVVARVLALQSEEAELQDKTSTN